MDITIALGFKQYKDLNDDEKPRGRYEGTDWMGFFRPLEAVGAEGKKIGHDSIFGKGDVVDLCKNHRLHGCCLLLRLPMNFAEWKSVEEVGGVSKIVSRLEQQRGRMDVTGIAHAGVFLGDVCEGDNEDEWDFFEVKM